MHMWSSSIHIWCIATRRNSYSKLGLLSIIYHKDETYGSYHLVLEYLVELHCALFVIVCFIYFLCLKITCIEISHASYAVDQLLLCIQKNYFKRSLCMLLFQCRVLNVVGPSLDFHIGRPNSLQLFDFSNLYGQNLIFLCWFLQLRVIMFSLVFGGIITIIDPKRNKYQYLNRNF